MTCWDVRCWLCRLHSLLCFAFCILRSCLLYTFYGETKRKCPHCGKQSCVFAFVNYIFKTLTAGVLLKCKSLHSVCFDMWNNVEISFVEYTFYCDINGIHWSSSFSSPPSLSGGRGPLGCILSCLYFPCRSSPTCHCYCTCFEMSQESREGI